MAARKNRKASLANVVITVLVVVGAFWYFSSVYGAGYVTGVDARQSATTDRKNPAPASTGVSSGSGSTEHSGAAYGQRGWKRQPDGIFAGLGISPKIGSSFIVPTLPASGSGTA